MKSKGTYNPGIAVTGQVPFKEPYESSKRFKGQIYLLIGKPTFSTAANFAAEVKWFEIGTLLGQETSGQRDHFGQILPIQSPQSKLQFQVSTAHFGALGGIQDRGGIKPDHEVRQTPEDSSRGGIDTVLEYALALTRTAAR
jgi:C-terminal processing protease CtpA/Prc